MARRKALILTAGGGRGAYHLGALKRLQEVGWLEMGHLPDYIAGASIGSVHAAALIEGLGPQELLDGWEQHLTSELVQEAAGPEPLRSLLAYVLHRNLTPEGKPPEDDEVFGGTGKGPSLGGMLADLVDGKVRAVLESTMAQPYLYQSHWFEVLRRLGPKLTALERVNDPGAPTLVVPAVDVCRGTKRIFCNKPWVDWQGVKQPAVHFSYDHLNASASIQVAYPYGTVYEPAERDDRPYWDGAVADATPLDSLIDVVLGRGEALEDLEIVVVLLAPWHRPGDEEMPRPERLYETFTPALDWMMLAPFTVALKRLTDRKLPLPTIIAPSAAFWKSQMALDRVIEYKAELHRRLAGQAYKDAAALFPG